MDEARKAVRKDVEATLQYALEKNPELASEIIAEEVNKLTRVVATLAPTVGKLDRRYAKLEEMEIRGTLERLCFGGGFMVDRGVVEPGKLAVDVIISGRG